MTELRKRLLQGKCVEVTGKYAASRFYLQRIEGELGVMFLSAMDDRGDRIRYANVMWGTEGCEEWMRNVRMLGEFVPLPQLPVPSSINFEVKDPRRAKQAVDALTLPMFLEKYSRGLPSSVSARADRRRP